MCESGRIIIREGSLQDLDRVMEIYDQARSMMRRSGNRIQWVNGYPQRELIREDMLSGSFYVCVSLSGRMLGCFSLVCGPDPTYRVIEDGQWLSEEPYLVLHRLASDGSVHGLGAFCLNWCLERCSSLRVDTHADNAVMQHILEKEGFTRCGIIYVADGTPRIAYEKKIKK